MILLNPHRRKAVTDATTSKWPGNNIPVFKKDNEAKKELEALVEKLSPDCTFESAGFNVESIKQHILDVLNKRRRRHRSGHDYNKASRIFFFNFNNTLQGYITDITWLRGDTKFLFEC